MSREEVFFNGAELVWYNRSMKRKFFAFLAAVFLAAGVINLGMSRGAWAACSGKFDGGTFFGLNPWYANLEKDATGGVCSDNFAGDNLKVTIVQIIMTVLSDMFFVTGILAVIFVIYSGYMMITAGGDVGKVEKAKSNLTAAITGVVITIMASVIVNVIRIIFWR